MKIFLLRAGEYMLKKGTKPLFEKYLRNNLKRSLGYYCNKIIMKDGRIYLYHKEEQEQIVSDILAKTFGISDYHLSFYCKSTIAEIQQNILHLVQPYSNLKINFKIEAKRTNKSFSHNSYEIACVMGEWILKHCSSWQVNVQTPNITVVIEIREKAYLYLLWNNKEKISTGGLPVGASGRGLLMLSGGIDSPVAGYLMNKRGLNIVAVHFSTPPYTDHESLMKVETLSKQLSPWNTGRLRLYILNFTSIQLKINNIPKPEFTTIVSRIIMMKIAKIIMEQEDAKAIITGESLSQVASQTLESLQVSDALVNALILRPCLSMDKQEIITIAKKIETFKTSIIPATDCCSLFSPQHPSTRPKVKEVEELVNSLALDEIFIDVINKAEIKTF